MAEGFDYDQLRQRDEFPVMEALMKRVDLVISDLQELVSANSGLPKVEPFAPMEDLLSGYEAATAVWRLDDGIQAFPYDLRTEALAVVPSHLLVEASAGEYAGNPSQYAAEIRRDYGRQRLPSVRSVGYTGVLNMQSSLSDMYHEVLYAADAARIDPIDLILDEEHFLHALVRGKTEPAQFIAEEIKAIDAITPEAIIAERAERLRQELRPSGSMDADEKMALEHTLADTVGSRSIQYAALLETSALRHGHAVATELRVKKLWGPQALRQVDPDVRELLDDALRTNFPLP
ncbi:MAG: hypothetical protein KIH63_001395 [Candidatus Saccharibacteria bacterium]|nr:hypothetical protein [Candidatus Saccharibacteria bacterium]